MKWIDKNKSMPNHEEEVLCCNINDDDCPICIGIRADNDFFIFEIKSLTSNVTHWMEMPNKPNKSIKKSK